MNLELFGIVVILVIISLLCCAIAQICICGYTCLRKCVFGRGRRQAGQTDVENSSNRNVQQANSSALNGPYLSRPYGISRYPAMRAIPSQIQDVPFSQRTASLISTSNPILSQAPLQFTSNSRPQFSPGARMLFFQPSQTEVTEWCDDEQGHNTIDLPPTYEEAMRASATDQK